jgi:UDP-galactopyranose mutase
MPQVTIDDAKRGPSCLREGPGYDYLIVGAGFAGSVIAERLAQGLGSNVLLIDRRDHIGGNAYDHHDAAGVLVHRYGPHIFHTNAQRIVDYLSRFTQWRNYEHRVLANVDGKLLPIPINLTTLNTLYGLSMTPEQAELFLAERAEPVATIRTSEDVVVNQIGRELYEKFFRGYTRKQWGLDPSSLDKSVTSRIPTRTNEDDRYFTDAFQMMPRDGYTRMFERMLEHPRIDVLLDTDFKEVRGLLSYAHLIYCGPIDEYFEFQFGRLPYRSLRFEHRILEQERYQPVAVVNFPEQSVPYTRITEYKHLTGQTHACTSISYEYPCDDGDPYYPVPRPENAELYKRYKALADSTLAVTFLGRLGTYKYYNMDQVVGQALALYQRIEAQAGAESEEAGVPVR